MTFQLGAYVDVVNYEIVAKRAGARAAGVEMPNVPRKRS
jgi:hypothetical protein